MAKHKVLQRYILKISTSRLRKAKWDLKLSLSEARRNEEVISIGDSQMLRWIDELNGVVDADEKAKQVRHAIKTLRREPSSTVNKRKIRKLYDELDRLQFKPDYLHLVIDRDKDLLRACKGFRINNVKYVRLLGTSGGVKMSTVVFVSERLAPSLRERIDNGRNKEIPLVPAKFEAYRALTCSGSTPVSMPNGILVVPDCETNFKEDVLYITDENDGEPELREVTDYEITLTESDGYGLMLPCLAERWSQELGLNYTAGGMNTRCSFEKGMVFAFDFIDFAERIAGNYIVHDAWGNEVDIRNVELVLTTSMLKLWNSYDSMDSYLACCEKNKYTFGITKVCPEKLENKRATNYQFLQSYNIDDDQINALVRPTINEIQEVIDGDYRKALLFLCGTQLDERSVKEQSEFVKAMMIEPKMFSDPYIKKKIKGMIAKRINDAKIGVIDVHGNYSIVCGDPYALCQSVFGLPVTGLLKAGEIYNQYWDKSGSEYLACFRAPMSCHNNIKKMKVARGDAVRYWYKYITTGTMFNAWDSSCAALNGMDKDGDLVMLSDNKVLVDNIRDVPTLFCVQRAATKSVITEDALVAANIASFGNEVGRVTNYVTSMYDVQAQYEPESKEYRVLDYRIQSGQLYQQNTIDKTKGVICKPMPKYWHDAASIRHDENMDDETKAFNLKVVADRKPYFMRYIYPALMKEYNAYVKNTNMKSICEFRMPITELLQLSDDQLTEEQRRFIFYYWKRMPVGVHDCVMNRICRIVEEAFSTGNAENEHMFDYTIMKSGASYHKDQYYAMEKLLKAYNEKMSELSMRNDFCASNSDELSEYITHIQNEFREKAAGISSNDEQFCDIILDLCYRKSGTKQFAWDMAAGLIVKNLLVKNSNKLSYPIADPDGDITYMGDRYSMTMMEVELAE